VAEYYLDIEVYSPKRRPDPKRDKVITIQYQKIDMRTGKPRGDLKIMKEWESSEEEIVKKFHDRFFKKQKTVWDFIPVGNNLNFEFEFMQEKFNKFCHTDYTSFNFHYNMPHFDIHPLLLILNNGEFKGSGLHNFTGKKTSGVVIKDYYEDQDYDKIIQYIEEETEAFLIFLQKIMGNSSKWLKDIVDV